VGHLDDKVLDSRARTRRSVDPAAQAVSGVRTPLYEPTRKLSKTSFALIKRDGRREEFSRLKLERGLMRACEKRPISADQIHRSRRSSHREFRGESEVTSEQIGQAVMDRLHRLDEVAYVRFASVYRRFADVNQFLKAVRDAVGKE
jgi:transcriptional repressor NrdR